MSYFTIQSDIHIHEIYTGSMMKIKSRIFKSG